MSRPGLRSKLQLRAHPPLTRIPRWLIGGSSLRSNASEIATGFLKLVAYQYPHEQQKRGGASCISNTTTPFLENRAFRTEDILWAVGIWSVILTLSPVVVFYVLMVA